MISVQTTPVGSTIATLEGKTIITAGHDVLAKMAAISGKTKCFLDTMEMVDENAKKSSVSNSVKTNS